MVNVLKVQFPRCSCFKDHCRAC